MIGKTKKIIFTASLFSALLMVIAVFLLTGQDAGTSYFKSTLQEILKDMNGWSFDADRISGNPFTGYKAENIRIFFENGEVARAENITVHLSLLSLLKGSPGAGKIFVTNTFISTEEFFDALRKTNFPSSSGGMPKFLPVVVLSPSVLATPLGNLSLNLLRLSPGDGTVTFEGKGNFLGTPVEVGGSLAAENTVSLTNAFLKAGETTVSLSGEVSPEIFLEGNVENLHLETIASLANLPFSAKGTVSSTLTVSRPGGKVLVSGEGDIQNGEIWNLLTEGTFRWSADEQKATLSPVKGKVFSSPVEGTLSVFFGRRLLTEMKLRLKNADFKEWTRVFQWLSFGQGTLSTLNVDLEGPFNSLSGPIVLSSTKSLLQNFPVTELKGNLFLTNGKTIDLDAVGKWNDSPFSAKGEIQVGRKGTTSTKLRLRSEKLNLKNVGMIYAHGISLDGVGTGEASMTFSPDGELDLAGRLTASNFSILESRAENLSVVFSGTKNTVAISTFSMSLPGGGILTGKGNLTNLAGTTPRMALEGDGKSIRWSFIESLVAPTKPLGFAGLFDLHWTAQSPLADPTVEFELKGRDTPLSANLPLRDTTVKGRLARRELSLSDGTASLWGAKVDFSGKTSFDPFPTLDFAGSFSGLSLKQATAQWGTTLRKTEGVLAGTFSLSGKAASPVLSLSVNGPDLSVEGLPVKDFLGKAEGTLPLVKLSAFSARILDTALSAAGTVELSKGGKVDIVASAKELDLRTVSGTFFPDVNLGGKVDGELSISRHTGGTISVVFTGTSPLVTFHGALLEKTKASLVLDGKGGFSLFAQGSLGKDHFSVEGRVAFTAAGMEIILQNSAKIDLGAAAAGFSAQAADMFSGEADFHAKGLFGEKETSWKGAITSKKLDFYRTEVNDVNIPFVWKDGTVTVTDGTAHYHGGTVTFAGKMDPLTMRWEGNLSVKGINLENATRRILEKHGKISGKADLTLRGSGTGGMVGMVFGSGQLSAWDGALSGFDSLKAVSEKGEVKFSSVLASFNVDGRNVFLLPGSRVSSPVGDSVYRYFSASGSLGWNNSPLDLKCVGDINVRALNAFLGALQGILSIDTADGNPLTDPQFLQHFLSGLLGGMSVRDFRETAFNLKGTWNAPVLSGLKVTNTVTPASISRPDDSGKNETPIKITVEIPTGEGKNTSTSTEDQVKKQLLENIMKQIIKPGSTEDGTSKN